MEDVSLGREEEDKFISSEAFLLSPQLNELAQYSGVYTEIGQFLLWSLKHIVSSGGHCNRALKSLGFNGYWSNNSTKYVFVFV
jgi:hypothetical protein